MKERFEEKGFEIEFAKDFRSYQWNKLFVNSVINPITALTRKQNSVVISVSLKNTVERLVEECVSVADKEDDILPIEIMSLILYILLPQKPL